MSRLSKTASAAVAAAVVSGAAAVAPLLGPSATGDDAGGRPLATSSASVPVPPSAPAVSSRATSAIGGDEASALPPGSAASSRALAARPTLLFVGTGPALRPPGGSASSFACLAAVALERQCSVASRAAGSPRGVRVAAVVLVMGPADTSASLRAALDALPPALHPTRTVILAPVAVTAAKPVVAHLPAIRVLAAARGVDVVDPVAQGWITSATRAAYLAADGVRPTPAGAAHLADRLSRALAAVGV